MFWCAVSFRLGGSATVATPLTTTLMYLVENPDKLAKLKEELDAATATNAVGELPSWDQIRGLPYLTGCINECLRLRPSPAVGMSLHVCVTLNVLDSLFIFLLLLTNICICPLFRSCKRLDGGCDHERMVLPQGHKYVFFHVVYLPLAQKYPHPVYTHPFSPSLSFL